MPAKFASRKQPSGRLYLCRVVVTRSPPCLAQSSSTLTLGVGAGSRSGYFKMALLAEGLFLKGASVRVAALSASKHQAIEQDTGRRYGYYVMIM